MDRFKLFLFYSVMAFTSLVNPKQARDMIECAEEGAAARIKWKVKAHYEKLLRVPNVS